MVDYRHVVVGGARCSKGQACLLEPLENRRLLANAISNILPLGDSITESFTGHASYRYWMWNSLVSAGYRVNFVGTGAGVADGLPLYPGFDADHEGHSGWRADELDALLASAEWKSFASQPQNKPDFVLLHVGSNDLEQGESPADTRDEISSIIDDLRAVNPKVTVLLAQVIPDARGATSEFNKLLPALAVSKNSSRSRVILVNQAKGFSASDTFDGTHPNESGEKKMSSKWLAALAPLLPEPWTPASGTFLDSSAIRLTNSTNALGPVEYELSNGDDLQYDGHMLSMRGQTYLRGFGVHAPSELDFDLSGGSYSRFRATVGVDDETEGNGSVIFQVYVNNESTPRFSTKTLTGESAAQAIDVDISGATSLRLVATDSGDGNDFDHADWAEARVLTSAGPQSGPVVGSPPAQDVVPSAPRKLGAKLNGRRVNLKWRDTASDESGFDVQRRIGLRGDWQTIAQLDANAHAFRDTRILSSLHYSYRVFAYNDVGYSNASNLVNVGVPVLAKKTTAKAVKVEARLAPQFPMIIDALPKARIVSLSVLNLIGGL